MAIRKYTNNMTDHDDPEFCLQAPERLKFALRKIEDMPYLEEVDLSGATTLSRVSSDLRFIQNMLAQIRRALMISQANWRDIIKTDPNVKNCLIELADVGICIEVNIFNFLETVAKKIKPGWVPDSLKNMDAKFVNFISINNLMVGVHNIKSRVERIKIEDLSVPSHRAITEPARQSLHHVDDVWLPVLEPHRKCILQRLIDQSLQTRSLVLVGTNVFANTVLLEKIYQSTEVKTHFEECFWLFPKHYTSCDRFSMCKPIDIFRKMLLKLGDTDSLDAHDEHDIMSSLHQSLSRKRCLVVVDNNWIELCTLVNAVFPDGKNGSRLLIPTKNRETIELLKDLGKDFLELEDDRTLLKLEADGPWDSIYDIPIPSVLKTCFVYTAAVFPCGSVILADLLIRLWIFEGLIPHEGETTMENIAESYLEQLLQRGFLRIFRAYYHNQANHPIRSIMLHPHWHSDVNDRAHIMYNDMHVCPENLLDTFPVTNIESLSGSWHGMAVFERTMDNLRGLAFHLPYQFNRIFFREKKLILKGARFPSLHSLFFFNFAAPVASSPFTFVRVLAVFSSHIRFPKEYTPCWLDKLINLRYLGFIVCLVEGGSLGKTLNRLVKLETLDLSESFVSGLSEFIKNNKKVNVVGPVKEELPESWSPIPDMFQ